MAVYTGYLQLYTLGTIVNHFDISFFPRANPTQGKQRTFISNYTHNDQIETSKQRNKTIKTYVFIK